MKNKHAYWIFKLYSTCDNTTKVRNAMHGLFIVGSPLSFRLNPTEHTTKIKSNIVSIEKTLYTEHGYQVLPRFVIYQKLAIVP